MSNETVVGGSRKAPAQRNALSRLWNNKEARSVIVQIFALVVICALFASMVNNAITNLEAIGKGFSFSFLNQPASYDINQRLIEYDSRSTHFRAMQVGILNTLLVAFMGIVLATVLGFILGVLRLSKNWLTNKIAHVYIEYVRNVPVLLHILLVYGIMVHSMPKPKDAIFCLIVGRKRFKTIQGKRIPFFGSVWLP